jgi:hypothetical protein
MQTVESTGGSTREMTGLVWSTSGSGEVAMSKLTEQFRTVGVFNAWEFAGKGNVYIEYFAGESGRGCRCARFQVVRPGYKTDPDAHWQDNYCKTVTCWGRSDKERALAEIKAWASHRYDIKEWARTPYGSWMDAKFVESRIAELKAQVKKVEK